MKASLRTTLSAVVLLPLIAITGCSGPSVPSSSTSAATEGSDASAATNEGHGSSTPTPSSSQAGKTVGSITVPAGWEQSKAWTDKKANEVYGLKSGVAVFSGVTAPVTISSYDKEGKKVAESTPVSGIQRVRTTDVFASYAGGKPYLILVQTGELPAAQGTNEAPSGGVYYSVMDADTGKIIHEKLHDTKADRDVDPRSDGSSVSFTALNSVGISITNVINPVTGLVDETAESRNRRWMARVDGVDIYADQATDFPRIIAVSASNWSIPEAWVDKVSGPREDLRPIVQGKYINLATDANPCMVIDVHTGVEAQFSVDNPNLCMAEYESPILKEDDARLYFNVLPMTDTSRTRSYLNPETGKLVKVAGGDTFVGAFTGGDGAIYGVSSSVPSTMVPAKLDLIHGEAELLGASPETGLIHAASGDGVIAIPTRDSASNTEYVFLAN